MVREQFTSESLAGLHWLEFVPNYLRNQISFLDACLRIVHNTSESKLTGTGLDLLLLL